MVSEIHQQFPVGLLAEASVVPQAELLVHLLQADEVPLGTIMVAVTLEASIAVAASGDLPEEAMEEVTGEGMEEATGKLKE